MPFTHVEIEERKTATLAWLFACLVLLYLGSIALLLWGGRLFLELPGGWSPSQVLWLAGLAGSAAGVHWVTSTTRLADRVLGALVAQPLDAGDAYHARLKNIVEEVSVATGSRYRIEPYVIATPALNACAVSDFNGRSAIAVTEGLLARLNRSQLEAVIGHEAAHIAHGDSLSRSVFCGLFGLHEEALKRLTGLFEGKHLRIRGRAGGLIVFIILVLWVTKTAKRFCELCISREQEYRADAVAVRLTRNPLSMAESLHVISNHWRGVGTYGESLSTLFILDPVTTSLSEREGLFAEWFSTHPPTARRIESLVGMAHVKPEDFERAMDEAASRPRRRRPAGGTVEPPAAPSSRRWFLRGTEEWFGPLTLEELQGREDFTAEQWVRREDQDVVQPAYQDPHLLETLRLRYGPRDDASAQPAAGECPNCHIPLSRLLYEGAPIATCPSCRGCYLSKSQLSRVFAREEYDFPEPVKRLGDLLLKDGGRLMASKRLHAANRVPVNRACPACRSAVIRKFYTEAYPVEVEQCWACGLSWLDHQELELLQYLYEKRRPAEEGLAPDEARAAEDS